MRQGRRPRHGGWIARGSSRRPENEEAGWGAPPPGPDRGVEAGANAGPNIRYGRLDPVDLDRLRVAGQVRGVPREPSAERKQLGAACGCVEVGLPVWADLAGW